MNEVAYKELIVPYENAVRVLVTQLENLQHELKESKTVRNPIDSIHHRIKTYDSLLEKCQKRNVNSNDIPAVKDTIKDIGGIRIICLYRDDVERVARMIGNTPGVSIYEKKDYIATPKENGYQSLHLITYVQIPSVVDGNQIVPVEVQIRTLAMQAWAQVEHRAKYKAKNPADAEAADQLKKVADLLQQVDEIFVNIRTRSNDD